MTEAKENSAKFSIGELVQYKRLGAQAVIFDIDPEFSLSERWYQQQGFGQPAKQEPWYHLLVSNSAETVYVPQELLTAACNPEPINHPLLGRYFTSFEFGSYRPY